MIQHLKDSNFNLIFLSGFRQNSTAKGKILSLHVASNSKATRYKASVKPYLYVTTIVV